MTASRPEGVTATRLRPGRNHMPREQVVEIQRVRLLAAAVEVIREVGYQRMTVAQVIARAKVSRTTFYDVFPDRETCFLEVFEQTLAQMRQLACDAYERATNWRDGIRSALIALLVFMEDEPDLARLCVVEAMGAHASVLNRRREVLEDLGRLLDRGRLLSSATREPSSITAEGVLGGILEVLHTRLLAADGEPLTSLFAPLMSMIVLPYLGARAASRELERPPPEGFLPASLRKSDADGDRLASVKVRVTYRTMRVLAVIGERPGASNREVAESAGISDQGQISKLLSRLADLGLIENHGQGRDRGAANAWRLTRLGVRVARMTRSGGSTGDLRAT